MDIKELQRNWDQFGKTDALRSILNGAPTPDGWNEEDFFRTGKLDIDAAFGNLERLGTLPRRGRALDFGCGVGRLTQALCERFDSVVGVDIAPAMIERARRYNRFGDRCQYVVNDRDDLSRFPDGAFDFVYSLIVLQHMKPEYSQRYLKEFLRITVPRGVVVFQIPAGLKGREAVKLPDDAFQARIEQVDHIEFLHSGEKKKIRVRITNQSPKPWAEHAQGRALELNLGNHWLSAAGQVLVLDDARTRVPTPVLPEQTVQVDLLVKAPTAPGRYILELDLVQEGVSWFAERGSSTCRRSIEVRSANGAGDDNASETAGSEFHPRMEMYCVPRTAVEQLVNENGGTLLGVIEHRAAGPAFENYQYFVERRGQGNLLHRLFRTARSRIRWRFGHRA